MGRSTSAPGCSSCEAPPGLAAALAETSTREGVDGREEEPRGGVLGVTEAKSKAAMDTAAEVAVDMPAVEPFIVVAVMVL